MVSKTRMAQAWSHKSLESWAFNSLSSSGGTEKGTNQPLSKKPAGTRGGAGFPDSHLLLVWAFFWGGVQELQCQGLTLTAISFCSLSVSIFENLH